MTDVHKTLVALALVFVGALLPGVALDVVAVLALVFLVLSGVLSADVAAQRFGNTTLLAVACMFVLAEALQRTGTADHVITIARRAGKGSMRRLFLAVLPIVMVLSALMNNTGVVVLLLPAFVAISEDLGVPPSRLLLPLSYAAILGGTLTLVGTTTNLLVDGLVRNSGLEGLGMLEFMPMGLAFSAVGLVYLIVIGPRLLPDRTGLTTLVSRTYRSDYMTEVVLGSDSSFVNKRLADFPELTERVRFLQVVRGEETIWPPFRDLPLQAGDLLLLKGPPEDLVKLLQQRGHTGPPDPEGGGRVQGVTLDLAEVMIAPGSRLDGATVREAALRARFGAVVLAVLRHGEHLRAQLSAMNLRIGDTLLVQGREEDLRRLAESPDLILLGGSQPKARRRHKAPIAVFITLIALGLAAAQVVDLAFAALLAAVALVATGCLSSGQAYRSINLKLVVILGCMLGVGMAVDESGLADTIAGYIVDIGSLLGPHGTLAAVYLATALLTEIVTNAGTAGIMVPIGVATAQIAGVSEKPFIMAVALAASCSLLTPIGYQTNLLVYGPGGYRFTDYLRVGLPLTIVLWLLATFLLPIVFPF